jgi:hypothetical protein
VLNPDDDEDVEEGWPCSPGEFSVDPVGAAFIGPGADTVSDVVDPNVGLESPVEELDGDGIADGIADSPLKLEGSRVPQ